MKTTELKDPVCGMSVDTASVHRSELHGKTYFFCSQRCMEKFAANPCKLPGET